MTIADFLDVNAELDLYLVVNGLKPAAWLSIDPKLPRLADHCTKATRQDGDIAYTLYRLAPETAAQVKQGMDSLGIPYTHEEQEERVEGYELGKLTSVTASLMQKISAGTSQEALGALLNARDYRAQGTALGYPRESVEAFQTAVNGEMRDGNYALIALAKAKKAGIPLPLWLAYAGWVPDQLDLVGDIISPSTKALAEKYQAFTRANNPELANRVEQFFEERKLPDRWEKRADGSYVVCYKFPEIVQSAAS